MPAVWRKLPPEVTRLPVKLPPRAMSQALRSLTQIAGPLLAGLLYTQLGGESPFWLGAAVMLLGIGSILLAAPHLAAPESLPEKA